MKKILVFFIIMSIFVINVNAEDEIIVVTNETTTVQTTQETTTTTTEGVVVVNTTNPPSAGQGEGDGIVVYTKESSTSESARYTDEDGLTSRVVTEAQRKRNKIYLIVLAIVGGVILFGLFVFFVQAIRAENLM